MKLKILKARKFFIVFILFSSCLAFSNDFSENKPSHRQCKTKQGAGLIDPHVLSNFESFSVFTACANSIDKTKKFAYWGGFSACVCGAGEGTKKLFLGTIESAKESMTDPLGAISATVDFFANYDANLELIYKELEAQEWTTPEGEGKLSFEERQAIQCQTMTEYLIGGGGASQIVSKVLKKSKDLRLLSKQRKIAEKTSKLNEEKLLKIEEIIAKKIPIRLHRAERAIKRKLTLSEEKTLNKITRMMNEESNLSNDMKDIKKVKMLENAGFNDVEIDQLIALAGI